MRIAGTSLSDKGSRVTIMKGHTLDSRKSGAFKCMKIEMIMR